MEKIIYDLLSFLIVFTAIFAINYLWSLRKIKKHKKIDLVDYVTNRFKLDSKKIKATNMILIISLINALIISLAYTVITNLNISFIWQLMIAFILIFALIYSLYELYGRYLIKKGYQRKEQA